MKTPDPQQYKKVQGLFIGDEIYYSTRWESDLLDAAIFLHIDRPTPRETIEIRVEQEFLQPSDVRQLIRELQEWLQLVESGERYPEYRGYNPSQRVHFKDDTSGLTLCGLRTSLNTHRSAVLTPLCPNCNERRHELEQQPPQPMQE